MDQLSSEVLEMVIMELDSKEMVKVQRVCKRFNETIDESKRFWRRLVIPDELKGWNNSILDRFNRKSQSSITEISIKTPRIENEEGFIQTVERSRQSLVSFRLDSEQASIEGSFDLDKSMFPELVDFRVIDSYVGGNEPVVRLLQGHDVEDAGAKSLRIFWQLEFNGKAAVLWGNLTSLSIQDGVRDCREWRRLLELPSRNLKHLSGAFFTFEEEPVALPSLAFPCLEVLEISGNITYPSWLMAPPSLKIVLRQFSIPIGLPATSQLWIPCPGTDFQCDLDDLPSLSTLRLYRMVRRPSSDVARIAKKVNELLAVLRQRKVKLDAGLEVNGIKMTPIETMIIDFEMLNDTQATELKGLVGEVIDSRNVSSFIEVEV